MNKMSLHAMTPNLSKSTGQTREHVLTNGYPVLPDPRDVHNERDRA